MTSSGRVMSTEKIGWTMAKARFVRTSVTAARAAHRDHQARHGGPDRGGDQGGLQRLVGDVARGRLRIVADAVRAAAREVLHVVAQIAHPGAGLVERLVGVLACAVQGLRCEAARILGITAGVAADRSGACHGVLSLVDGGSYGLRPRLMTNAT